MQFSVHPDLDIDQLRSGFARDGMAVISPFILEAEAEKLRQALLARDDWRLRMRATTGRVFDLSPEDIATWGEERIQAIRDLIWAQRDQDGFVSVRRQIRIVEKDGRRLLPPGPLVDFANFVDSRPVLDFIKAVGSEPGLNFANCFAARFDPGDYITSHDDAVGTRRVAYIFGLTRDWRSSWGGDLLLHGGDGSVEHRLQPAFNAMNIFAVPREHSVAPILAEAAEPRLTMTGWFYEGKPNG